MKAFVSNATKRSRELTIDSLANAMVYEQRFVDEESAAISTPDHLLLRVCLQVSLQLHVRDLAIATVPSTIHYNVFRPKAFLVVQLEVAVDMLEIIRVSRT